MTLFEWERERFDELNHNSYSPVRQHISELGEAAISPLFTTKLIGEFASQATRKADFSQSGGKLIDVEMRPER